MTIFGRLCKGLRLRISRGKSHIHAISGNFYPVKFENYLTGVFSSFRRIAFAICSGCIRPGSGEDRYHATAVERGEDLARCMVYIDTNMVRAGVVSHPSEWSFSGYNEIQEPRRKNVLIDYE